METFLIKAAQLLLSLSILVVLHELGHFIPAKIFKTRVEKFYLFFDVKFSLFKKKIGETVYGIGWLPLGGYVKIAGMIDESMDTEQMKQPPQPWEFRSKPAWQRLIIMVGGVTVNILVGFLIYSLILYNYGREVVTVDDVPAGFAVSEQLKPYGIEDGDRIIAVNGKPLVNLLDANSYIMLRKHKSFDVLKQNGAVETVTLPNDIGMTLFKSGDLQPLSPFYLIQIDSVLPGSPAANAGIKKGDKITAVNGKPITYWQEFIRFIKSNEGKEFQLTFESNGQTNQTTLTPNEDNIIGIIQATSSEYAMMKTTQLNYNFGESFASGIGFGTQVLANYMGQFKFVFTKQGASQLGGFGAIGNLFPDTWDWKNFWMTTALISIILAFMNILPIPALDGGHVMFLLYEMITGRTPNQKVMEYAQMIGFFILIALFLYANGNDIYRAIFK